MSTKGASDLDGFLVITALTLVLLLGLFARYVLA